MGSITIHFDREDSKDPSASFGIREGVTGPTTGNIGTDGLLKEAVVMGYISGSRRIGTMVIVFLLSMHGTTATAASSKGPPYEDARSAALPHSDMTGYATATGTATADVSGAMSASSRAVGELPAGAGVPFTPYSVGYARGAASGEIYQSFSIGGAGTYTVTLSFSDVTGKFVYGKERLWVGPLCLDCVNSQALPQAYATGWAGFFPCADPETCQATADTYGPARHFPDAVDGDLAVSFDIEVDAAGTLVVVGSMASITETYGDADVLSAISGTLTNIDVSP